MLQKLNFVDKHDITPYSILPRANIRNWHWMTSNGHVPSRTPRHKLGRPVPHGGHRSPSWGNLWGRGWHGQKDWWGNFGGRDIVICGSGLWCGEWFSRLGKIFVTVSLTHLRTRGATGIWKKMKKIWVMRRADKINGISWELRLCASKKSHLETLTIRPSE